MISIVTLPLPEPSHPLLASKITIFLSPPISIIRDKREITAHTFFNGKLVLVRILLEKIQVRKQYLFWQDQVEMGRVLPINKKTNQKKRFN